jgi:hypothetical protein
MKLCMVFFRARSSADDNVEQPQWNTRTYYEKVWINGQFQSSSDLTAETAPKQQTQQPNDTATSESGSSLPKSSSTPTLSSSPSSTLSLSSKPEEAQGGIPEKKWEFPWPQQMETHSTNLTCWVFSTIWACVRTRDILVSKER